LGNVLGLPHNYRVLWGRHRPGHAAGRRHDVKNDGQEEQEPGQDGQHDGYNRRRRGQDRAQPGHDPAPGQPKDRIPTFLLFLLPKYPGVVLHLISLLNEQ